MILLVNNGWKSGLREWILQRFTGLYIAVYFLFLSCVFLFSDNLTYLNWTLFISSSFFKILTILFIFNIVLHCNLGLSIILTDYIKNSVLRLLLDFLINIVLLSYIFFIMQILWSFK